MSTPVRRAIYGRLAGDVTLNALLAAPADGYSKAIYFDAAPENAGFPYVIFSKSSGVPTDTFHTPGYFQTDVWLVKAIDRNWSADTADAIALRLIALLNDATLSISGASLLMLRKESDVQFPQVRDGEMFKHAGALFRLVYQ